MRKEEENVNTRKPETVKKTRPNSLGPLKNQKLIPFHVRVVWLIKIWSTVSDNNK